MRTKHTQWALTAVVALSLGHSLPALAQNADGKTIFGAMIVQDSTQSRMDVLNSLGITRMRSSIVMQNWTGSTPALDTYASAGLQSLLNIDNSRPGQDSSGHNIPVPFPTDLVAYGATLQSILTKYKPELVVIENEENNIGNYYSGTADQYIAMLQTAIPIAHAKGLKITNGGLTGRGLRFLVLDDYLSRGMKTQADDFAMRTLPAGLDTTYQTTMYTNKHNSEELAFAKAVVAAYKVLPLDYVNFHWYEPQDALVGKPGQPTDIEAIQHANTKNVAEVVDFLRRATGKIVINNEMGQHNHAAGVVDDMISISTQLGLPIVAWYSGDGKNDWQNAVALQNDDKTLRPGGTSFHDDVAAYMKPPVRTPLKNAIRKVVKIVVKAAK